MTLKELLAQLKATSDSISAIDKQQTELVAKEDLSDADSATYDELAAKRDKLTAKHTLQAKQVAAEKERIAREETERQISNDISNLDARRPLGTGRKTDATTDDTAKDDIKVHAPNFLSDPNRGFKSPRDFLLSVISAGRGFRLDERLMPLRQATVGSDEARGISDPAGGFLIPEGFSPNLFKIMPEADPMGGLTQNVPMATPIVKIPARVDKNHSSSVSGGLTVTRRPETVAGTASQMTFERITLDAHELFGLSYATEEVLADSPVSFVALLSAGFSDQFTSHLINERLNGTGVGEFLGVMQALDSSSLGPTVSVSKETGQAAATIVYENIVNMRARCWGYGKAIWLANHDTLPQLMLLNQAVGTGGVPVWQPSAREDRPDVLLGRPLVFTEYCKTLGTTGDVVLGNWSEYLEGMYQPLQSAESIHVRFVNHERAFKFWLRNAGSPWWRSALTPKNSTAKLSPFVILATRS